MSTSSKMFYQDEDQAKYFINKASILCAQCMMESLQAIRKNLFHCHNSYVDAAVGTPQDMAFFCFSSEDVIFQDLYTKNLEVLSSYFYDSSPKALFESIEALMERAPWYIEGEKAIKEEHEKLKKEDEAYQKIATLALKRNGFSVDLSVKNDYHEREQFSNEILRPIFKELVNKCKDLPPRHLFLVEAWGKKLDEIASFAFRSIASIQPMALQNENSLSFEKPPTVDAHSIRHLKR